MDEKKKVIQTGIIVLVLIVVAISIYYFLVYKKSKATPPIKEGEIASLKKKEAITPEEKQLPELPPVELDKSDDLVRRLAGELSSHPRLAVWLRSTNLMRRFTAAIDNIANGLSPRPNIDFFAPKSNFKAVKKGSLYYIVDPASYARYNPVIDVFISLDSKECATLFRSLKPLFQTAYRELGYPNQDFEETLLRAIVEMLKTPVVEKDILLEKAVVNYLMVDPKLEELSEAQKHLLRMGPENVGAIQAKLREMAQALGVPDFQLPRPQYYTPEIRRP